MNGIRDQRKELRADLTTEVEFRIEDRIVNAHTIDVSNSGIRFETTSPIRISLKFKEDALPMEYLARLVWAQENDHGAMEYGFEYVNEGKTIVDEE